MIGIIYKINKKTLTVKIKKKIYNKKYNFHYMRDKKILVHFKYTFLKKGFLISLKGNKKYSKNKKFILHKIYDTRRNNIK
ncbi:30S ribosomal protein S17 [Candidatus Vidania fulgoroideorum]